MEVISIGILLGALQQPLANLPIPPKNTTPSRSRTNVYWNEYTYDWKEHQREWICEELRLKNKIHNLNQPRPFECWKYDFQTKPNNQ